MLRIGLCAVVLAGCHASIADAPDAAGGGGGGDDDDPIIDASVPGGDDAPTTPDAPAGPTCAAGRVVYLNFNGVALTKAAASDAKQHKASWMQAATANIPAWNAGSGNRAADIAAIVAGVQGALSTGFPGPITVTTTEPTSGEYVMIVYGGTAQQSTSRFGTAVNELDCDDSEKSDVAWIRDFNDPVKRTAVINTTLGAIGFGLGLTGTSITTDCMCGWANACTKDQTSICTFSENIARDPQASQLCNTGATQNEHSAVQAAFCTP